VQDASSAMRRYSTDRRAQAHLSGHYAVVKCGDTAAVLIHGEEASPRGSSHNTTMRSLPKYPFPCYPESIGNIKPLFTRAHPPAPPGAPPAAPALRSQRRPLDGGGWPCGLVLGDEQPARLGLLGLGGWGCSGGTAASAVLFPLCRHCSFPHLPTS
jgi:hypothetical protein